MYVCMYVCIYIRPVATHTNTHTHTHTHIYRAGDAMARGLQLMREMQAQLLKSLKRLVWSLTELMALEVTGLVWSLTRSGAILINNIKN